VEEISLSQCVWDTVWSRKARELRLTPYERRWYAFLFELARSRAFRVVLEAGCGSGRGLAFFHASAYMVGLDISLSSIKLSKQFLSEFRGYDLVLGDIRYLPFKEAAFDLVFNSGVIEHFPEDSSLDQLALMEMARVTCPRGYVLTAVPNSFCLWYSVYRFALRVLKRWKFGYEHSYRPSKLRNLLINAGLSDVKLLGVCLTPFGGDFLKTLIKRLNHLCYAVVALGTKT